MSQPSRSYFTRVREFVTGAIQRRRSDADRRRLLRDASELGDGSGVGPAAWAQSLEDPSSFYARCFRYFHRGLDEELRAHRAFFSLEGRGYGEDAFHVMWQQLFMEFKPRNYLEIGVFRGQTLSLAGLLARRSGVPCETFGISPFSPRRRFREHLCARGRLRGRHA